MRVQGYVHIDLADPAPKIIDGYWHEWINGQWVSTGIKAEGEDGNGVVIRYMRSEIRPVKPATGNLNPSGWMVQVDNPVNNDIYWPGFVGGWTKQANGEYKSEPIGHNENSPLRFNFFNRTAGSELRITVRTSSESYDKLYVGKLDESLGENYNNARLNFGGTQSQELTYALPSKGEHYILFDYKKDGSVSSGSDAAYVKVELPIQKVWMTICNVINGVGQAWSEPSLFIDNRIEETIAATDRSKAITDKFGTTTDGGLIQTVMMLLREANTDIVTAGVSGIQGINKNHPAFWAGGTSEKAIALIEFLQKMATGITPSSKEYENLAKIVMLHNGAAKVGDLIVEDSGRVVIIDPLTAVSRLVLGATSLPTISNLISGSNFSGGVNLPATQTSSITQLSESLNITYDMSLCTLSAMYISVTGAGRAYQGGMSSFAECVLWAKKDGVRYTSLNSAMVYFLSLNDTVEYEVFNAPSKTFHLPKGYYTFELEVRKAGLVSSASGNIGASSLNWTFSYNVRRLQFGTDGFMAYFNNNHIHFTEDGGLDVRGKTNMPGVLASGTVSASGTQSNVWGPKSSSSCNRTSTGVYRVYHNIGHTQYNAVATPHESNIASVEVRASTYIDVRIVLRGNGDVANKPFDYIIVGKNYA